MNRRSFFAVVAGAASMAVGKALASEPEGVSARFVTIKRYSQALPWPACGYPGDYPTRRDCRAFFESRRGNFAGFRFE